MKHGNSEALNSREFELAAGQVPGLVVFRNNCGMYYNDNGDPVTFGVAGKPNAKSPSLGGSDFIGWYYGRFAAFEIKGDNTPCTLEQENFIAQVIESGGVAGFVRRPIDITEILAGRGCVRLKDYPRERLSE